LSAPHVYYTAPHPRFYFFSLEESMLLILWRSLPWSARARLEAWPPCFNKELSSARAKKCTHSKKVRKLFATYFFQGFVRSCFNFVSKNALLVRPPGLKVQATQGLSKVTFFHLCIPRFGFLSAGEFSEFWLFYLRTTCAEGTTPTYFPKLGFFCVTEFLGGHLGSVFLPIFGRSSISALLDTRRSGLFWI